MAQFTLWKSVLRVCGKDWYTEEATMEDYYQKETWLKEEWRRGVDYFGNRGHPKQSFSSDCLNEFSKEEKEALFSDAYSCIGMFYELLGDALIKRQPIEKA